MERCRNSGDGGKRELPNELSEAVGEGFGSCDPSDLASASNPGDLSAGTMSRNHSSS